MSSEWAIEDMIADGDRVVARTPMRATHQGDFFGIPPTGRRVEMSGIHILGIGGGKIVEHWGNNHDLDLLRQLGAIPAPSSTSRESHPNRPTEGASILNAACPFQIAIGSQTNP